MNQPITRRKALQVAAGGAVAATTFAPFGIVRANTNWPSKPVRIIVPYTPGGSSDIIARAISEPLSQALKQTVVVENRPGANGNTGANLVATSTDEHTLLLHDVGALAISSSVYRKLPFNPAKDLRGVTMLAYSPHLLTVHPSVKANNLKELVELSKREQLNVAITAVGSAPHVAAAAIEQATGARWTYIPYKGGSQAILDTVAGQTQVLVNGMLATLPHVQSGKLKVLGVSKATRVPLLANVPTISELGVQGFESGTWQGLLAPATMPDAALQKLSTEVTRIIRSPEVRERLVSQGAEVATMSPQQFAQFFAKEQKTWADVVRKGNIVAD